MINLLQAANVIALLQLTQFAARSQLLHRFPYSMAILGGPDLLGITLNVIIGWDPKKC